MRNGVCVALVCSLFSGLAEADPPAVENWQLQHPDSLVVGWQLIRHEDMTAGTYLLKTLGHGAVYLHETSWGEGYGMLSEIKSFNWNEYGVLDPALARVMISDHLYRVAIYPRITFDEMDVSVEPSSEVEQLLGEIRSNAAAQLEGPLSALASEIENAGGTELVIPTLAPFVLATLTGEQLDGLRWSQEIDYVELAVGQPPELYDDDALGKTVATRAVQNDVWWAQGQLGTGRTISIVEAPGIRWDSSGWYSSSIANQSLGGASASSTPNGTACWMTTDLLDATRHTNAVASVAAGTFFDGSGAKNARIVSANVCHDPAKNFGWDLVDLVIPAEGSLTYFPSVLNHSYGAEGHVELPQSYNNAMDYRIRFGRTTEIHACGNNGAEQPSITMPRTPGNWPAACNEYNSIKVGGYDDQRTIDWSDDLRYLFGSYVNPLVQTGPGGLLVTSDRELPEVVAPAVDVRRAAVDWQSTDPALTDVVDHGTSFAAPNVSALAALFLDRFPGFAVTPEFVRAALYATAIHNRFDGSKIPPPNFSGATKTGSGYIADQRTGFGGVSGKALSLLISPNGVGQGIAQQLVVTQGDFQGIAGQNQNRRLYSACAILGVPCAIGNSKLLRLLPTYTTAHPVERVRIVLAWNSRMECIQCTPELISKNAPLDFDLVLVDGTTNEALWWDGASSTWSTTPGAGVPVSSFSFHNSYEVIELSPQQVESLPPNTRVELRLFGVVPPNFSERLGYVAFAVPAAEFLEPQP